MNSKTIIVGAVVGFAVLLLLYFNLNRDRSPKYNWYQTFDNKKEFPYGTWVIKQMLEASHKGTKTTNEKESIHKLLAGKKFTKTDYVLIGQSMYLDPQDVEALKGFLADGNNVFIASLEPPQSLFDVVYTNECDIPITYDVDLDSIVSMNFYHPSLRRDRDYKFAYRLGADDFSYYWRRVDASALCDSTVNFSSLGYQQRDHVNFYRMSYGDGQVYVHTAPLILTNYFLTKPEGREYASGVFSHLNGDNLIWDEVSKVPLTDLDNPYDSPLYYIMQQPALKYAWWMLLVGALLYIVFASKRTQRIIPVLEPKTNTSLEFLNVISSLHYQNPDHLDMARKKMKYFLYFIRARYGINATVLTQDHVKRLAEKAKVDESLVQAILDRYRTIESYATFNEEPDRLVALYHEIEKFYKTCK